MSATLSSRRLVGGGSVARSPLFRRFLEAAYVEVGICRSKRATEFPHDHVEGCLIDGRFIAQIFERPRDQFEMPFLHCHGELHSFENPLLDGSA